MMLGLKSAYGIGFAACLGLAAAYASSNGDGNGIDGGTTTIDSGTTEDPTMARATLQDMDGDDVGEVTFLARDGAIEVWAKVTDLSPGFHGFHIHGTGQCDPDFGHAGGHFNPGSTDHPDHAGDMPPLLANQNGEAELRFLTDRVTVAQLLSGDGTTIIVHQDPDNLANIPARYTDHGPDDVTLNTGDAGGRFACGVVAEADDVSEGTPATPAAKADLLDMEGDEIGVVTFATVNGHVEVSATVHDLPAGFHGFHVHGTGECTPDFGHSGGHNNPGNNDHPNHASDMPVLFVLEDGTGSITFLTDRVAISGGGQSLTGGTGTAIIVHADPDNYANIPERYEASGPDQDTLNTGDAGDRIGCGVVELID